MEIDLNNLSKEHSKILDQIWKNGINDFNQFYDSQILEYSNDLNYLLSGAATRDVYLNRIYESICYLKLLKKIFQEEQVESVKIKNLTIEKMLKADPELKKIRISFSIKKRIQELILIPVAYLLSIYRMIKEFALVRFYICNYDIPNEVILFDSFLIESSFPEGRFNDIYFPGLQELIREKSKVFYLFTILLKKYRVNLLRLKNSNIRFIHRYQFLKLSDLCSAAMKPILILKYLYKKNIIFQSLDIAKSFRYELVRTSVAGSIFDSVLNYRFIYRLKQKNIKIDKFIDWFENQQIDRGYALGLRQFYGNSKYFGCLGSVPIKTQFHLYPTKNELNTKLVPEHLFVIGRNYIPDYTESCKGLKLDTMPAFRYTHLYKEDNISFSNFSKNSGNFKILVTLPIEFSQTLKILKIINNIKILLNSEFSFYLKFHPAYSSQLIEKFLKKNEISDFPILKGNIGDCLSDKQLLISSNSSTCLEALAFGIPVLVVTSNDGITHLSFSENITKEIWGLCYDEGEVLKNILYFSKNYDSDYFQSIGKKIKNENFVKLDSSSLKHFTNLVF
ncbi:hypothetical protein [Leptospira weilii]|uniref:Capsule polysaccharide biosynthesis protein n=1 Tax=Leptospira weilii str. UI 13098 TaxID=1088542 RepID=M6Q279_9LEPT|nr:hypothetical protein [Leptospira weilii]EMN89641.1 hypothetical protein LEP1GSC108_2457 [Leptospira weilii str. UI 13098]OMI17035.1 hypothetical protein BUQ74_12145 [Leptospira weilii serovar Heyan]